MVRTVDELTAKLNRRSGTTLVTPPTAQPGGLSAATSAPEYSGNDPDKIAARIMSKDSPLMHRAASMGRAFGASRGLLNSTMAGGAATTAALDYVVPLASQEGQQKTQMTISANEVAAANARSAAELANRTELARMDIAARRDEAAADRKFQLGLSGLQFERDRELLDVRIGSERDLALLDANVRQDLMQQEAEMRERLASMEIANDQRDQVARSTLGMQELYKEGQRTILNNPDLDAATREKLLRDEADTLNLQMAMVEDLYGVDLNWAGTPVAPVGGDGTPAPRPAAPPPAPVETEADRRERERERAIWER